MRTLSKNLLLLLMLVLLLGIFLRRFRELAKGSDFPEFYAAARMVRDGAGTQIYSLPAQQQFQERYTGRVGVYFNHPPFETLLYLPFSFGSMSSAYLLWSLLNLAALVAVAQLLQRHVLTQLDWRSILAICFLFVPVLLNFLQGQDAVILLLLLTLGFVRLRHGKAFSAGCLLACGLFKFHLALPLLVVLLAGKSKKLLAGFSVTGLCLLLISSIISGWGWPIAYTRFLLQLNMLPLAGIHPQEMANLRGLFAVLSPPGPWQFVATVIASLLLLGAAVLGWKRSGTGWGSSKNLAFANAVVAAVLVGYHLSPHDLSLLVLPLALIAQHLLTSRAMAKWLWGLFIVVLTIFLLPPLHVFLLVRRQYTFAALPLLLLFAITLAELKRTAAAPASR